jgi:hypothetical protein
MEQCERMAEELGVDLRVLDIDDSDQVRIADDLVKEYGDQADDYLIPQIFFEEQGKVEHVFTGFSEGLDVTKARWSDFFASQYYQSRLKRKS